MRTKDLPQTTRAGQYTRSGTQDDQLARRDVPPTESHWDELHDSANGTASRVLGMIRERLTHRAWSDLAVGVAAGFAAGWWLASRHRSHAMRDLFRGSLLPAASRRVHDAYDSLRGNGTFRELGHRVAKLKTPW